MDPTAAEAMNSYEAEYDAALDRLVAANRDLSDRFQALGVSVYYDLEEDQLLISIGPPGEAATLDLDEVISVRHDPETWKVLGFEIPSLRAFLETHPAIAEDIRPLADIAAKAPGTYVPVPRDEAAGMMKDLRELVRA